MTHRREFGALPVLLIRLRVGWSITQPLAMIAVCGFGLIFRQPVIGAPLLRGGVPLPAVRVGRVLAAQIFCLVTGFGVLWATALLGERSSGYVWAALALMCLAMAQPRPRLARLGSPDNDAPQGFGETS